MVRLISGEAINHHREQHARASQARICLSREQNELKLVIEDNGVGFEFNGPSKRVARLEGMGLSSMKERAELSGGSFSLESHLGQGTVIEASWPLNKKIGVETRTD